MAKMKGSGASTFRLAAALVGMISPGLASTRSVATLNESAQRTARWSTPAGDDVDLAQEAVAMINAKTALKANVEVMKTTDEMLGVLLDITA